MFNILSGPSRISRTILIGTANEKKQKKSNHQLRTSGNNWPELASLPVRGRIHTAKWSGVQGGQSIYMYICKLKSQLVAALCNYTFPGRVCHWEVTNHKIDWLWDYIDYIKQNSQVAPSMTRQRVFLPGCLDGIHWMSNQGIGGAIEDASAKSCTGLGRNAKSQIFGCRATNKLWSNLK